MWTPLATWGSAGIPLGTASGTTSGSTSNFYEIPPIRNPVFGASRTPKRSYWEVVQSLSIPGLPITETTPDIRCCRWHITARRKPADENIGNFYDTDLLKKKEGRVGRASPRAGKIPQGRPVDDRGRNSLPGFSTASRLYATCLIISNVPR